tara:strand:+ start:14664 stop:15197 length:534 start_codon:yes stop_codon:yes gene_type:complete
MAYASTTDTRVHVLGDMLMVTGTFTDGGTEVDYSQFLSTVYAAGGHLTSITDTGIKVNGGNVAAGDTVLTVDTVEAREHFAAGQTVYNSSGTRLGVIASVDSDTQITLAAPGLTTGHANNENYYVMGANKPSETLISTSLDVSIDQTNSLILFECGNRSATSTASVEDGRWWILGTR